MSEREALRIVGSIITITGAAILSLIVWGLSGRLLVGVIAFGLQVLAYYGGMYNMKEYYEAGRRRL